MLVYSVKDRANPINHSVKYYAQLVAPRPVGLDSIAELISNKCTVTRADVKAVLAALEEEIFAALRNGQSVRLGDLGAFHLRLHSIGTDTPEAFTNANISGVRVRFTPSSRVRWNVNPGNPMVRFQMAGKPAAPAPPPPGPQDPGSEMLPGGGGGDGGGGSPESGGLQGA